jgi:serine/threonine protein kinase
MNVKLTDIGVACIKNDQMISNRIDNHNRIVTTALESRNKRNTKVAGTYIYQAPESLLAEVQDVLGVADIYSFGVTLYECLTRRYPQDDFYQAYAKVVNKAMDENVTMLPFPVEHKPLNKEEKLCFLLLEHISFACTSKSCSSRPNASDLKKIFNQCEFTNFRII